MRKETSLEKASVIIPCRNEFRSLVFSVPFMSVACNSIGEVLIVADSSEDDSFKVREFFSFQNFDIKYLVNSEVGVFGAIKTGIDSARFDKCLVIPADELVPIIKIDEMVNCLTPTIRFVSATRNSCGGRRFGGNTFGKFFSNSGNLFLRFLYPATITDFTTGIKAFYKKDWAIISEDADGKGWSCALVFALNAIRNDLGVCQVPVTSVDRFAGGQSSFSLFGWMWSYLRVLFNGYSAGSVRK